MARPIKPMNKSMKKLFFQHRVEPNKMPLKKVMEKLELGKDYNKFYRFFYQAAMTDV